ncbi:hypothetical protein OAG21_04615 [Akkermansiaceae bacterium]|nr:hypothetical protein [Akkermansiaceae bacterium]MDB4764506.1 hypothetical protein [Akkermansiaceae bacterium]
MKLRILKTCFAILATGSLAAETLVVFSGESIQAKIDEAADGDIIAIFGGTYFPDLTINKRVRLVEVKGQEVKLAGSISFTDVENCPPFQGFEVGPTKGITVSNCSGLVLADLTVPSITQNSGSISLSKVTITGDFNTGDDAAETLAFRTTVIGDCNWKSKRAWFGYGKARSFNFSGSDAKVIFVGSEIDGLRRNRSTGFTISGTNNSLLVCNSIIRGTISSFSYNIRIQGGGHSARIFNNYLKREFSDYANIQDDSANGKIVIANNIFSNTDNPLVRAPSGVEISNNHSVNSLNAIVGGAVAVNTTTGDPVLVDSDPYKLGEGSPLIDAGTQDPRYHDRDGTRNNIGPSGGSWYDPQGWTTEKPVVISFDLLPDQVLEGVNDSVTIDNIKAAASPAQE